MVPLFEVSGKSLVEFFSKNEFFSACLGESIPIRLFLGGYDLTPTMKDVQRKFSVRYFLNLVLIDEEERRYFKQQVIRKKFPPNIALDFLFPRKLFSGENKIKPNRKIPLSNMLTTNPRLRSSNRKIVSRV